MDNFQEQVYKTVDIIVSEKLKALEFDKTEKGEVISIGDYDCQVRINGEVVTCKIIENDNFDVGDIVYVKTPKNREYDRYAEAGSMRRYTHIKYSDDEGKGFTGSNGYDEGSWVGMYTDKIKEDSDNPSDYNWVRIKGAEGLSQRIWIRYSDFEDGGRENGDDIQNNPKDKKYIGIATSTKDAPPQHPKSYTWSKIEGTDGVKGENGYVHIKYSNTEGKVKEFTRNENGFRDGETVGIYIGVYTDNKKPDSNRPSDYKWNKVVGDDGETQRTYIRYSKFEGGIDEHGVSSFGTNPRNMEYIGIGLSTNEKPPKDAHSYTWSKIQGLEGVPGKNGYVHIKYSNSDGVDKVFTQPGNGERVGDWIGVYTDNKEEDSNDPTDYTWNKVKGDSERTWIRYSSKSDGGRAGGQDMVPDPEDMEFIGIATTVDGIAPTDPKEYNWSKIQGTDGVEGKNGYTHIKYSNNRGKGFTEDEFGNPTGETVGIYIGIYVDHKEEDSEYPSDYKWNKVVGADGISQYTWIRYSDFEDGGAANGSNKGEDFYRDPTDREYIGIGLSTNGIAPINPNSYTWSKIQGTDGIEGESGYLHIKYSNTEGTNKVFTDNNGEDVGRWIGIYTDNKKTDSNIPSDYKWKKIEGDPGRGIESITEYYLATNSGTGVTGNEKGWTPTIQQVSKSRKYLWNYEHIVYSNGDEQSTAPLIAGTYSEDGVGIKSITEYYLASSQKTGITWGSEGWSTKVQAIDGKDRRFLWNYELTTYTNEKTERSSPIVIGIAGQDGYNGEDAVVGILSNDSHVIPADEAGWVDEKDYTNVQTTFDIYYGTYRDTDNWELRVPYQENMEGHLEGNVYVVDYVSSLGGGHAELEATRDGFPTIKKTFTVTTSPRGKSSNSYWLVIDTHVLKEDKNGNYDKNTVNVKALMQSGDSEPVPYEGRFGVIDGVGSNYWHYASRVDESEITFTPNKDIDSLDVLLLPAGFYVGVGFAWNTLDRETITVVKDGVDGTIITSITEYYQASSSSSGVQIGGGLWSEDVPTLGETNKYLWNYEVIEYSDGENHTSKPVVIGTFSKDGVGITSITEYYLASSSSSGITVDHPDWSTKLAEPDFIDKYLWNYEVTLYSNKTSTTTDPMVIGAYGRDGVDGKPGEDGVDGEPGDDGKPGIDGDPGSDGTNGTDGEPGVDGLPAHVHVRYSTFMHGGLHEDDMTDNPKDMEFIGIASTHEAIAPTDPKKYSWSKIQGTDGVNGVDGNFTHIKYSDDGKTFTPAKDGIPKGEVLGKWIGIYVDSNKKDSATFSDYRWKKIAGEDGDSNYVWIKYSLNADGSPMLNDPKFAKYIGIANVMSSTPPNFNWQYDWTLIKGDQGVKGRDSYIHIKYSNDGGRNFTKQVGLEDGEAVGDWIGIYQDDKEEDSMSVSKYKWKKIKGEEAISVDKVEVEYVRSNSPTELSSQDWSTEAPVWIKGYYIWSRTKTTYSDKKEPTYSRPASITGYHGDDGQSNYVWVRYSLKSNGGNSFDMQESSEGMKYIGIAHTDENKAPTVPSKYQWSKHVGDDGKEGASGKDGKGITSALVTYTMHTSGTSAPTSGWAGTVPSPLTKGRYLWTRTVTTYTIGENTTTYSVSYVPTDGQKGSDGKGIVSTSIQYQKHGNGTTPPTGTWSDSTPAPTQGQYLWTRTVMTYTTGSPSISYSTSYYATDGQRGATGSSGKDGKGVTSTTVSYAYHSSGINAPTTGWKGIVPDVEKGRYLWTRTVSFYTDGSDITTYSVSYIATDGQGGSDGKGIVSTVVEYKVNQSGTVAPTGTWSVTIPPTSGGDYLWTRTTITYTVGNPSTSYSTSYHSRDGQRGQTGQTGGTGATGRGVTDIKPQWFLSTTAYGQTGANRKWEYTPPNWIVNNYMWTRSEITYNKAPLTEHTKAVRSDIENRLGVAEVHLNKLDGEMYGVAGKDGLTSAFYMSGTRIMLNSANINLNGKVTFDSFDSAMSQDYNSTKSTANAANSAAATAQRKANTADSNAATAQGTANTANSNAATAQGTANTANSNAATAQGTANTAKNKVDSVTTVYLGNTVIDGGKIKTRSITANQIAVNQITANEIATNAITSKHIKTNSLSGDVINGGTITGSTITGGEFISKRTNVSGRDSVWGNWSGNTSMSLKDDRVAFDTVRNYSSYGRGLGSIVMSDDGIEMTQDYPRSHASYSTANLESSGLFMEILSATPSTTGVGTGSIEMDRTTGNMELNVNASSYTKIGLTNFYPENSYNNKGVAFSTEGDVGVGNVYNNANINVHGNIDAKRIRTNRIESSSSTRLTMAANIDVIGSLSLDGNFTTGSTMQMNGRVNVAGNFYPLGDGTRQTSHVVQTGSNENGNFIKFSDGTLICSMYRTDSNVSVSTTTGVMYRSGGVGWTYPSRFNKKPSVSYTSEAGSRNLFMQQTEGNTTSAKYRFVMTQSGTLGNVEVHLTAIGTWK